MSSSFLQQTSFPLPSKGSWQTVASQPLTSPPREARTSLSLSLAVERPCGGLIYGGWVPAPHTSQVPSLKTGMEACETLSQGRLPTEQRSEKSSKGKELWGIK